MASQDWSMRYAMQEFIKFANPVIRYKKKEYKKRGNNWCGIWFNKRLSIWKMYFK